MTGAGGKIVVFVHPPAYNMVVFKHLLLSDPAADILVARWTTADDVAEAARRQATRKKAEFLLGRALLRSLLAEAGGDPELPFSYDRRGKLLAAEGWVSVTHSGGMVAAALSSAAMTGIDVERWRPRDFRRLADYAFGPLEREEVARDGCAAFYRIWTAREALAKTTGEGLAQVTDGIDRACAITKGWQRRGDNQLFHEELKEGYSLAVVCLPPM